MLKVEPTHQRGRMTTRIVAKTSLSPTKNVRRYSISKNKRDGATVSTKRE